MMWPLALALREIRLVLTPLVLLVLLVHVDAQVSNLAEQALPAIANAERIYSQGPCDDESGRNTFDFIVVGAGAGGCTVANRLSEIPGWDILLLEAGGDETFAMDIPYFSGTQPETDWNFTLVPQPSGGCPMGPEGHCRFPRGFVMGGSTTVNLMIFTRGNRKDFDNWKAMGNPGWGYDDVLPYFKKMENVQIPELRNSSYHGTKGNIMNSQPFSTILANYSLQAARELGIPEVDYNGEQEEGISRMQSTTYQGKRWSANRGYILGLKRRNFFLRRHSMVTKVIIENKRAIGVEYIRNGKIQKAFAKKEVIISSGAINSPKILMMSGIGPQDHLEEVGIPVIMNLPVGKNLYDHSMFIGLIIKLNSSIVPSRNEILSNVSNIFEYVLNHEGMLGSLRGSEVIRFYKIGEEAVNMSWVNMEVFMSNQPFILREGVYGFSEEFQQQFANPISNEPAIQPIVVNLRPKSKGTVTLQDNGVYSQPIIDPKYFSVEEDVTLTVEAVKDAIRLFTSGPFEALGARVYDTPIPPCASMPWGTDEYWACAIRWASSSIYHPSSTCKMGPREDPTSVVSPTLKVWGIQGLRVADASVMPYILSAHLQVGTYMIGEKAADLVKCEHLGWRYCSALDKGL